MESNINTAGDLLKIPDMNFGSVRGASFNILQNSQDKTHKRIVNKILDYGYISLSNLEAFEKVLEGNLAFVTPYFDSLAPDDFCKVKRVGDRLKESFITMVIQKNSPYREMINEGIMKLQGEGVIEKIMEKWIRFSERNCDQIIKSKLALTNIGGNFIFLGVGVCVAFVCSFIMMVSRKLKKKIYTKKDCHHRQ